MLSRDEVVADLHRRGLLRELAGDVEVRDASRRNRNTIVSPGGGDGYFVKQGVGAERASSVANEAAMYRRLASPGGAARLDGYLPQLRAYDPARNLLVLGLIPGASSLRMYHGGRGHFSLTLAARLGDALGRLHCPRTHPSAEGEAAGSSQPPWVLSLHRPDLRLLHRLSAGTIELVKTMQQIPEMCERLDELRLGWEATALVHNDVRWDNCLVFPAPGAGRVTRLNLIDWELAGWGDPCWDLGSAFSEYLAFWLESIPLTGDDAPDRYMELARFPVERMQPAMRALWGTYLRRCDVGPSESNRLLHRSVAYGAAKLVQRAFERTQTATRMGSDAVCLLQLAANMLERPSDAASTLLGIHPDGGVHR